jgi:hypothetical protein
MEGALHRFHTLNNVILLRRAGQWAKAKANALRNELMKKRKVDEETNDETWTPSCKRRKMNAWWDYISHKIDVANELGDNFQCPKIRLMSHLVQQIRLYRALQQFSAERYKQEQKPNPKDSLNASNHNLNYLPQLITFQRRIPCFEVRELNLQALAQHCENITDACKVVPSGTDLAAPLRSQ